jgi:hypothetical protein
MGWDHFKSSVISVLSVVKKSAFASAFLRRDPLQLPVHRAEDMGAAARSGGDFEFALSVAAFSGGRLDERVVGIESCENKVFIQVAGFELIWVSASRRISAALRFFLK